jgi:hypothetical protein
MFKSLKGLFFAITIFYITLFHHLHRVFKAF